MRGFAFMATYFRGISFQSLVVKADQMAILSTRQVRCPVGVSLVTRPNNEFKSWKIANQESA